MPKNVIDDETKRKIATAYSVMTAQAVGQEYGISERQVRRISKEVASWPEPQQDQKEGDDASGFIDEDTLNYAYEFGISPKFIRIQYLSIYEAQIRAAAHYHEMASDERTANNCAWGNLELRFLEAATKSLTNLHEMAGSHRLKSYVGKDMTPEEQEYKRIEEQLKDAHRRNAIDLDAMIVSKRIDWDAVDESIHRTREDMVRIFGDEDEMTED